MNIFYEWTYWQMSVKHAKHITHASSDRSPTQVTMTQLWTCKVNLVKLSIEGPQVYDKPPNLHPLTIQRGLIINHSNPDKNFSNLIGMGMSTSDVSRCQTDWEMFYNRGGGGLRFESAACEKIDVRLKSAIYIHIIYSNYTKCIIRKCILNTNCSVFASLLLISLWIPSEDWKCTNWSSTIHKDIVSLYKITTLLGQSCHCLPDTFHTGRIHPSFYSLCCSLWDDLPQFWRAVIVLCTILGTISYSIVWRGTRKVG